MSEKIRAKPLLAANLSHAVAATSPPKAKLSGILSHQLPG
jgi:hypothetical protein